LKIRLNWQEMQNSLENYFIVRRERITFFNIITHVLLKIM
jgi:hypothetical protein